MGVDKKKIKELARRINSSSNADFVKRLLDAKRKTLKNTDGTVSTHELGYVTNVNDAVVFPGVQSVGDSLVRFPYPESYERAVGNGDTVHMSIPDAELFTKGYKEVYPGFEQYSSGGRIHIDPKNKGKFNNTKKRTGKTTEELTHSKNPLTRKRAIFAQNAAKWNKHAEGGLLRVYDGGSPGSYMWYNPQFDPTPSAELLAQADAALAASKKGREKPKRKTAQEKYNDELAQAIIATGNGAPRNEFLGTPQEQPLEEEHPLAAVMIGGATGNLISRAGLRGIGEGLAKGIEWAGEKAMPSALLKGAASYLPETAGFVNTVAPWADAAALSYWSTLGANAAIDAAKSGDTLGAVTYGGLAALPVAMPLGMSGMPIMKKFAREAKDYASAYRDIKQNGLGIDIDLTPMGQMVEDANKLDTFNRNMKTLNRFYAIAKRGKVFPYFPNDPAKKYNLQRLYSQKLSDIYGSFIDEARNSGMSWEEYMSSPEVTSLLSMPDFKFAPQKIGSTIPNKLNRNNPSSRSDRISILTTVQDQLNIARKTQQAYANAYRERFGEWPEVFPDALSLANDIISTRTFSRIPITVEEAARKHVSGLPAPWWFDLGVSGAPGTDLFSSPSLLNANRIRRSLRRGRDLFNQGYNAGRYKWNDTSKYDIDDTSINDAFDIMTDAKQRASELSSKFVPDYNEAAISEKMKYISDRAFAMNKREKVELPGQKQVELNVNSGNSANLSNEAKRIYRSHDVDRLKRSIVRDEQKLFEMQRKYDAIEKTLDTGLDETGKVLSDNEIAELADVYRSGNAKASIDGLAAAVRRDKELLKNADPALYQIYTENPEYLEFIARTGKDPLKQETVDDFIRLQSTAMRGVAGDSGNMVAVKRYLSDPKNYIGKTGGDRLYIGNKKYSGVYTSNSYGIADRFSRPQDGHADAFRGTLLYPFDETVNRALPIRNQLLQLRRNVLNYDDLISAGIRREDIAKAGRRIGLQAIEAQYANRYGEKLPVNERGYLGEKNLTISDIEVEHGAKDIHGRWGGDLKAYPRDKELFIPKITSEGDLERIEELLRNIGDIKKDPDEYNRIIELTRQRLNKANKLITTSKAYKAGKYIGGHRDDILTAGLTAGVAGVLSGIAYPGIKKVIDSNIENNELMQFCADLYGDAYPPRKENGEIDVRKEIDMRNAAEVAFRQAIEMKGLVAENKKANGGVIETLPATEYANKWDRIGNARYTMANDSLMRSGSDKVEADRLARFLAAQSALEAGWVDEANGNNYAGYMSNGKRMSFDNADAFWDYHIKNLDERWPGWRNAKTIDEYFDIINNTALGLTTKELFKEYNRTHRDNPAYIYAPDWDNENYLGKLRSIYDKHISKYVKPIFDVGGMMKRYGSDNIRAAILKMRNS